jgi:hypothetical protein
VCHAVLHDDAPLSSSSPRERKCHRVRSVAAGSFRIEIILTSVRHLELERETIVQFIFNPVPVIIIFAYPMS